MHLACCITWANINTRKFSEHVWLDEAKSLLVHLWETVSAASVSIYLAYEKRFESEWLQTFYDRHLAPLEWHLFLCVSQKNSVKCGNRKILYLKVLSVILSGNIFL